MLNLRKIFESFFARRVVEAKFPWDKFDDPDSNKRPAPNSDLMGSKNRDVKNIGIKGRQRQSISKKAMSYNDAVRQYPDAIKDLEANIRNPDEVRELEFTMIDGGRTLAYKAPPDTDIFEFGVWEDRDGEFQWTDPDQRQESEIIKTLGA